MDVDALVRPVVEASGLELVEVTFNRALLRVVVDRDGGVDLDTIAQTSERLSRRLDLEDVASGPYTLEVSSPGVERPLREARDFLKRVGEKVKVKTAEPVEGARSHVGILAAADDESVTLATDAGERRIAYEDVRSARTVFEWGGEPKPGGRPRKRSTT